jgi:hypothetical protein
LGVQVHELSSRLLESDAGQVDIGWQLDMEEVCMAENIEEVFESEVRPHRALRVGTTRA